MENAHIVKASFSGIVCKAQNRFHSFRGINKSWTIFIDGELDIFAYDYSRKYKVNPQQEIEISPVGDIFWASSKLRGEISINFWSESELICAFGEYILSFYLNPCL